MKCYRCDAVVRGCQCNLSCPWVYSCVGFCLVVFISQYNLSIICDFIYPWFDGFLNKAYQDGVFQDKLPKGACLCLPLLHANILIRFLIFLKQAVFIPSCLRLLMAIYSHQKNRWVWRVGGGLRLVVGSGRWWFGMGWDGRKSHPNPYAGSCLW